MAVLENLQPKEVFGFFEEICNIPHGSGNLQQISDFLVKFAKDRNLEYIQDDELNVIIKKPGTKGYEDKEPIILQGHMDMVAVKDPGIDKDMTRDGLDVQTDGSFVWAKGTSLGGDDGIAVAYCLALLDSDTIPHPPLEVVITTNEETGMDGARAIDLSSLKGKRLLNMDNEEEGVLLVSCAGGARFHSNLKVERQELSGTKYEVSIGGLLGGHSGEMIKKERGNANFLLARVLLKVKETVSIGVISMEGGVADNAIPSLSNAQIILPETETEDNLKAALNKVCSEIQEELAVKDPGFKIDLKCEGNATEKVLDETSFKKAMGLIISLPNGVQANSASIEGLVETSLNLGIMHLTSEELQLEYSVRSSVEQSKDMLLIKLRTITEAFGGYHSTNSSYPGWAYKEDSALRKHMVEVYKELNGEEPKVVAIHAGVECGLFSEKIEGLDCVSIGPDMEAIHSTGERLSVASTAKTWEFVKAILK
ncbi:MAG: aminoacyl-histidine dipeptidase [Butyrivibrio sp.]|nr:aminoacyl-histidine dipeptidase [Butyrivibrio sp.]